MSPHPPYTLDLAPYNFLLFHKAAVRETFPIVRQVVKVAKAILKTVMMGSSTFFFLLLSELGLLWTGHQNINDLVM